MARKGENIRKRKDGRWEARYIKGRDFDGGIQYGYVYARKYSEVKQKRDIIIQNLKITAPLARNHLSQITFDNILDQWEVERRYRVKDSSYFLYETVIEHHIRPYFGRLYLEQVTNNSIQTFINRKMEENLSTSYINYIELLLRCILRTSRRKYHLSPDLLDVRFTKTPNKTLNIFTYQEWKQLERHLLQQTDEFSFGILLCMYTGIRIGELSGLKWEDFDSFNQQLFVQRTVYRMKNPDYDYSENCPKTVLYTGTPKTPSSVRTIPLPQRLAEEMLQRRKQKHLFILTGSEHCLEPRTIQKRYKRLLRQCGLRYLNFHSLRHSFATIGIQKGFDHKTMSEILGHASVNMTLNVYVHSNMDQKRQCMELIMRD